MTERYLCLYCGKVVEDRYVHLVSHMHTGDTTEYYMFVSWLARRVFKLYESEAHT